MSTRTVVEFNHDYLNELWAHSHISDELFTALTGSEKEAAASLSRRNGLAGILFLGRRHHSESLSVNCGGRETFSEEASK